MKWRRPPLTAISPVFCVLKPSLNPFVRGSDHLTGDIYMVERYSPGCCHITAYGIPFLFGIFIAGMTELIYIKKDIFKTDNEYTTELAWQLECPSITP
jgi:hypothetical protein